jgi:hypothetical protein
MTEIERKILNSMMAKAKEALQGAEIQKNAQAIVLYTANDQAYGCFIADALSAEKKDEQALLDRLSEAEDTKVCYVLCVWQDRECMDLPSYQFRTMLCELNPDNKAAEIFMMTDNGTAPKALIATMK